MKSQNNNRTLLLLALLAIVLVIAYFHFSGGTEEVGTASDGNVAAVQEAVSLLDKVQGISFDFGILESAAFSFLKDRTTPLLNLPVGRANPFAPIK